MKKLFFTLSLFFLSSFTFSQDATFTKKKLIYKTEHNIIFDEYASNVYEQRIKQENPVISTISLNDREVFVKFQKNISDDDINTTLLNISRIFGYESFKVK